jgi:hypothetical protein
MSLGKGIHWKGPLFGSDQALAGGAEGVPADFMARTEWVSYFNDFTNIDTDFGIGLDAAVDVGEDWSATNATSSSASILVNAATADIGILRLDCAGSSDEIIVQRDGSGSVNLSPLGITPSAASTTAVRSEAVFAARYRILDVSAQNIFVGLANINANSTLGVLSAPGSGISADTHAGFHSDQSGVMVFTAAGDDDTNADTVTNFGTLVDSEWVDVCVRVEGLNRAQGFIRREGQTPGWSKVADISVTDNWDTQMLVTLANVGALAGDDLDVDWVYFATKRDLVINT